MVWGESAVIYTSTQLGGEGIWFQTTCGEDGPSQRPRIIHVSLLGYKAPTLSAVFWLWI